MKRWIGSLVLSSAAAASLAQVPFTIVRPADGSRVREKVHVLIPKGSIPPGGYVGVFLNDKFLEAVVPPLKGKYHDYILDTKGRGLPDSEPGKPDKLEFVLYAEADDKSRAVDRSSVDLRISNYANIPVPGDGLLLRYRFVPGSELIYNLTQKTSLSQETEQQRINGSRAAVTESEGEKLRLSYSVVNKYGNGDGLLRLQAMPMKGKDYADYTVDGNSGPQRFYENEMSSIYMRVTATGREIFGALPPYVPMEGTASTTVNNELLAAFPLPTLPSRAVRPGDSWQSGFQRGAIDLVNRYEVKSVVARYPARGEFVRVEWEKGHPCAVIRNVIESGTVSRDAARLANQNPALAEDKVGITETIWFSMDTRRIQKIVRDTTIERRSDVTAPGLGGGYGGPGGFPGGPGGAGMPGRGGPGGFPSGGDDNKQRGFGRPGGMPGGGQGMPGRPGMGGPGGAPGGFPGGPGFGRGGQGTGTSTSFTVIRIQQTFTLESAQ
jgi:hypothetical protein